MEIITMEMIYTLRIFTGQHACLKTNFRAQPWIKMSSWLPPEIPGPEFRGTSVGDMCYTFNSFSYLKSQPIMLLKTITITQPLSTGLNQDILADGVVSDARWYEIDGERHMMVVGVRWWLMVREGGR